MSGFQKILYRMTLPAALFVSIGGFALMITLSGVLLPEMATATGDEASMAEMNKIVIPFTWLFVGWAALSITLWALYAYLNGGMEKLKDMFA